MHQHLKYLLLESAGLWFMLYKWVTNRSLEDVQLTTKILLKWWNQIFLVKV